MDFKDFQNLVSEDFRMYSKGRQCKIKTWIMNPGFQLVFFFRLCQYLQNKRFCGLIYVVIRVAYRHLCIKYGIDLPSHSHIAGGLYIPHAIAGGIVINAEAIIGKNVTLLANVVIGGNHTGTPVIGDNCFFGTNSVTIGKITIGDGSQIGAGAVVTHDVGKNSVVIGPSAKQR